MQVTLGIGVGGQDKDKEGCCCSEETDSNLLVAFMSSRSGNGNKI